jgi:transposase InsO family protein
MSEKQFEWTIKCFHSDNRGEYTPVEKYAKQAGISVTRSAPYTPQPNGVAERMNRTLIESVRSTLLHSACQNRCGWKHWLTPSQSRIGFRATMVKVPAKH